jgi:hypothetical protein
MNFVAQENIHDENENSSLHDFLPLPVSPRPPFPLSPILLLILLSLTSCTKLFTDLDNPADPKAASYPGYDTVSDSSSIAPVYPAKSGTLSGAQVTMTKVAKATTYALRITASEVALASASFFTKSDYPTNLMDISASGIIDSTKYYWQTRASLDNGATWGSWSAAASFTTDFSTPVATPTFNPASGP